MMLDRVCFLARSVVLKAVWHFLSTFAIFYAAYKYLVVKGQNQFQVLPEGIGLGLGIGCKTLGFKGGTGMGHPHCGAASTGTDTILPR